MTSKPIPKNVYNYFNRFIIGQEEAKKKLSGIIATRYLRTQVPDPSLIKTNNVLLIGDTGTGKTEFARQLAKFIKSPLLITSITQYTEVGYVGKEVSSMIEQLALTSVDLVKKIHRENNKGKAKELAIEEIYKLVANTQSVDKSSIEFQTWRKNLIDGKFDNKEIEIDSHLISNDDDDSPDIESLNDLAKLISSNSGKTSHSDDENEKVKLTFAELIEILTEKLIDQTLSERKIKNEAKTLVEQNGIVFIDEIDKILNRNQSFESVSREGVQRDLLTLIEGTKIQTRIGLIDTTHILFIGAGAFKQSSVEDFMPELKGRFQTKIQLNPLTEEDYFNILNNVENSLIKQNQLVLGVANIELVFEEEANRLIARYAYEQNQGKHNTGARRLQTILTFLLDDIYFDIDYEAKNITITKAFVEEKMKSFDEKRSDYSPTFTV